jgi:SSS family transporter
MTVVFVCFLVLFLAIGISSAYFKEKSSKDYLLAGQNLKPWMVALSAVATNNSGYMFIGMIGFTYSIGLSSIWLMLGWITGDFIASLFIYKRLRDTSGEHSLMSFGEIVSHIGTGKISKYLKIIVGAISLIFLSTYAAAQLGAGGKALMDTIGIPHWIGVTGGATLVVVYCFSGGIRASVWTDAAQSFVMVIAMASLVVYGVMEVGGVSNGFEKLSTVSKDYMSLWPQFGGQKGLWWRIGLFILGWLFAGFGVVGQPHIMIRYMTLDDSKNMKKVRAWYYSWFSAFYLMTIIVGLLSRIVLKVENEFDPELALPRMAMELLPDYFVGVILAGIFAATISTADSLIISCSASVTNDLFSNFKGNYWLNKVATIVISILALFIALADSDSIFELVIYSWAVLGSAFGPLLTLGALNKVTSERTAIIMVLIGAIVAIIWKIFGLNSYVYEMLPGMLAGFTVYGVSRIGHRWYRQTERKEK